MLLPSQSAPIMPTASHAPAKCLRCGMALPSSRVACNQRTCRPTALRRVTLIPFVSLENDMHQHFDHTPSDLLHI